MVSCVALKICRTPKAQDNDDDNDHGPVEIADACVACHHEITVAKIEKLKWPRMNTDKHG